MEVAELLQEIAAGSISKRAITNHRVLNEAYAYGSAFSRGLRIDLNGISILLISGTASIDEKGNTIHVGDLPTSIQTWRQQTQAAVEAAAVPWWLGRLGRYRYPQLALRIHAGV